MSGHLIGVIRARGAQARVCPGRRVPVLRDQLVGLAGRLVLGHVELAAAVEPLLLTEHIGGHRLASAGL
jgi:hypothetical protein